MRTTRLCPNSLAPIRRQRRPLHRPGLHQPLKSVGHAVRRVPVRVQCQARRSGHPAPPRLPRKGRPRAIRQLGLSNHRTPAVKRRRGVEESRMLRSWTVPDFSTSRLLDSSTSFRAKSAHEVGSTALWPPFRYPIRRPHFEPPTRTGRRPAQATVGHPRSSGGISGIAMKRSSDARDLELEIRKWKLLRVAFDFRVLSFEILKRLHSLTSPACQAPATPRNSPREHPRCAIG